MSYDICLSLSDLLHSFSMTLGLSVLLQMAFCSFSLFSKIPLYIVPHLLYPLLCQWTFRLIPCPGYCKQCRHEHWSACIFSNYVSF